MVGFGLGERGCRFIHEYQPCVTGQSARNGHELALGNRQSFQSRFKIKLYAEFCQRIPGDVAQSPVINEARTIAE